MGQVKAQDTNNPFEINGKKKIQTTISTLPQSTAPTPSSTPAATPNKNKQSPSNPFEIIPSDTPKPKQNIEKKTSPKHTPKKTTTTPNTSRSKPEISTEKANVSGLLFILIVSMMILFAVLITLFRSYFYKIFQAFVSDNQLRAAHREMGLSFDPAYFILYIMAVFNASLFCFILIQYYGILEIPYWLFFLKIIGATSLLFLGKHLLVWGIGQVFPIQKEMNLYNFTITTFNLALGILLIPFNLLLAYGPPNLFTSFLYLAFVLIGVLYIYRSIRALLVAGKYLFLHKFHFFMYLCTAEIAPFVIVIIFILNQLY